jgi:hypothetical protein
MFMIPACWLVNTGGIGIAVCWLVGLLGMGFGRKGECLGKEDTVLLETTRRAVVLCRCCITKTPSKITLSYGNGNDELCRDETVRGGSSRLERCICSR